MGYIKVIFIVLVIFRQISISAFAKEEEQVLLLNSFVLHQFEEDLNQFLPIKTKALDFDFIKAYNVHDLGFSKNLTVFKQMSHEVGICGGFTQVAKADLNRIQKNISNQQSLKAEDELIQFKLQRSLSIEKSLAEIQRSNLKSDIDFLTQFKNRSARNSNNSEIEKIKNYILANIPPHQLNSTVQLISHRRTPQKTIHIQVKGKSDSRLIMGGHVDSINMGFSSVAPGADDNASGSAALMQILNAVLKRNIEPNYTLDFFWYAGEESGLIGSGEIAKDYARNKIPVIAVLQLDMLGVPDSSQKLYLEKDYSSTKLNKFLTEVAGTYMPSVQITYTSCGYPCSDHSSWYQENFPVVFPTSGNVSGNYNHRIHTQRDTADTIDLAYAEQVTRLGLAYLLAADLEL